MRVLEEDGVIVRYPLAPKTIVYHLSPRFASPAWPGFAREIDAVAENPIPWVTVEGRWYRKGVQQNQEPHLYEVPTLGLHFAPFLWVRGWIHLCQLGFFDQPNTARAAITILRESAREAPLLLLWRAIAASPRAAWQDFLAKNFKGTEVHRRTDLLLQQARSPRPESRKGIWLGNWAEQALDVLRENCRFAQGHRWIHPRFLAHRLSDMLLERMMHKLAALAKPPASPRAPTPVRPGDAHSVRAAIRDVLAHPGADHPFFTPRLELLEQRIRSLEPRVRGTMWQHQIAWPDYRSWSS